jgi:transcriptional regulator with XRE-family HTH domain
MRGWGVTDAAARIGMSKSHLSQLERGKIGLPSAALRRQIAEAYGVRHIDILIAAGELTSDEVDPRRQPAFGDTRLQAIADNWDQLTEKEKDFLLLVLEGNRRRRGLDGLDDIVQVVTNADTVRVASG